MGRIKFINGEYYHIYNRGVEKRDVFLDDYDYFRFLKSLKYFNQKDPIYSIYLRDSLEVGPLKNSEKLVDIISYCLNPNHFHLILRQSKDGGISEFMKRLGGGYTGYFNHKNKRSGVLFQGKFKAVHINSNEYLLHLSAYVNNNNFIHGYENKNWKFSSLLDYLGKRKDILCNKEIILSQFDNDFNKYAEFIKEKGLYMKNKKEMEKYLLE